MATMMEAMMSMKKIMEANAVASIATEVDLIHPSSINQASRPASDMVGKDVGSRDSPHNVQNQNKHAFPP